MRTGEIAKAIGVADQTINNWLKEPGLKEFISQGGIGQGLKQRSFTNEDLIVLNTIRELSIKHVDGKRILWDRITEELQGGYRNYDMPGVDLTGDDRKIPVSTVRNITDLAVIAKERDAAVNLAEYLKGELDKKDAKIDDLQLEIVKANRDAAKWQAMYEMMKEQGNK